MAGSPIFSVNRKILANLNCHMSIKTSQAILKCFIDLKSRVGLRWAQKKKPCFVTLGTFFSSNASQGFQNTNGWQFYILSKFHKITKIPANLNYHNVD